MWFVRRRVGFEGEIENAKGIRMTGWAGLCDRLGAVG